MKLFYTLALMVSTVFAADIVVFGDSWGTEGAFEFKKMASAHNLTVDNHAVSGSTAQQWARTPDKLTKWVESNKDAKYVWVTIGGNDAEPMLQRGVDIATIQTKVQGWVREFLDPLYAAVPDIKVVAFGYDLLFWDFIECVPISNQVFRRCGKHGQPGFAACANGLFIGLQAAFEELAAEYTAKGQSLTSPNLLGSFQTAGGVANASVGSPNMAYFSPNQYTDLTKFCLHANNKGYSYIFANLWDLFFAKNEEARLSGVKSLNTTRISTTF